MRLETLPITARSFENDYHINGDNFEKAYKNHLSGFREWTELDHAEEWLVFPDNIGPHVSIDETCLSTGEVYTIVCNKDASPKPCSHLTGSTISSSVLKLCKKCAGSIAENR